MLNALNVDQDPTVEFNEFCLDALRRWERGELAFKEAVTLVTAKEREAVTSGHLANQARANHLLGYLQHYRGDLSASIRHYERARQLFQRVGNAGRVATMDLNNGENYRLKGDFGRARRMYRAAYEAAQRLGMLHIQAIAGVNEGLALLAVGQIGSARKALLESKGLLQTLDEAPSKVNAMLCELHYGLTNIYLYESNFENAWEAAKTALEHAQHTNERMQLGMAYRGMGKVVTHVPSHGEPDHYFRLSLEIFRELNMEAEMARTVFAQAQSLAVRGRKTTAARKLQQVMIMFSKLGMTDDAAKAAEAQLAVI